jgi:CMP-N-acetylneuraminic acid synthetase
MSKDNVRSKSVVALIPVREGSSRVENKNFVPFGGHATLLENKIAQLKKADCFTKIYVSSDSERAKNIAQKCQVDFLPRDPVMCTGVPRWSDVVAHIMETIPGDPHVLWALATSPLFCRYSETVETYLNHLNTHDSLFTVKELKEYMVNEKGMPIYWSFGEWHPYSNELTPFYAINDAVFIAKKSDQLKWRYWIGQKPKIFKCQHIESIDVNFPEDLELAYAAQKMLDSKI